ncbi:MAG: metalloprotease [Candidatus Aenigmarchaeota archaeon]|nr:metalloprotease [Candidatus Aenigmarchaeota archaeon]
MKFTYREVRDLAVSVTVLALVFSGFDISLLIPTLFIMTAVFLSHEILGHKMVAQHYECEAEYRMWPLGLLLGMVTALLGGFIFAAPGAVYISPVIRKNFTFNVSRLTQREYAFISAAGPIVNIIVAFGMIAINQFYPWDIFMLTAKLSFFLALFNLIPFPPLDGEKIIRWNWKFWLVILISAIAGYVLIYL